ncbi:MAG: hypothetical protein O3A59_08405 [Nitrospirae bacterium]|nr:hypothetical protein [Nitrospirota bacterium]
MGCLGAGIVWPAIGYGETPVWNLGETQEFQVPAIPIHDKIPPPFSNATAGVLTIEAIEDLLDDLDCIELAARYVGTKHLERNKDKYKYEKHGRCPLCRCDEFSVTRQKFECEQCYREGNAITLFAILEGLTCREACGTLRGLLDAGELRGNKAQQVLLWKIMGEATAFFHDVLCHWPEGQPGRDWLAQQHISQETRDMWFLGYIPPHHSEFETELNAHLVGQGFQTPDIKDARVGVPAEGVTLPIQEANGKCWGYVNHHLNTTTESIYLRRMEDLSENRFARRIFPFPTWPRDVLRYETVLAVESEWDVIVLCQAGLHNVVYMGGWGDRKRSLRTALGLTSCLIIPVRPSYLFGRVFDEILPGMAGYHDRLGFLVLPDDEQDLLDVFRAEGADGLQARMINPLTVAQVLSM